MREFFGTSRYSSKRRGTGSSRIGSPRPSTNRRRSARCDRTRR